MLKLGLTALAAAAAVSFSHAAAAPGAPSLKPGQLHASKLVSTQDAALLSEALAAADDYDWARVAQLRAAARDPIVRDILTWLVATSNADILGFSDLADTLARLDDWPRTTVVRVRAEAKIRDSALSHEDRILWLRENGPLSGEGMAQLALSLRNTGRFEEADAAARDAWRNFTLDNDTTNLLLDRFAGAFSEDDHRARIDFLLWTGQRTAATRLRGRVSSDYRALMDARIALAARARGVDGKVDAVPPALQSNPGLLYDRARWRRRAGLYDTVSELLVQIDGADVPAAGRDDLWEERNLALRRELKDFNHATAYRLAAPHGMSEGVDFAEAEWVAGWLSLRHLNQPERALGHFTTLRAGVSTPISVSRAEYWIGRSLDTLGRPLDAASAYKAGAQHKIAFYGQLAAERAGEGGLVLPPPIEPTEMERDAFEARPVVRALRLLGEAGADGHFRRFAFHLDDMLESPAEHELLADLAAEYQRPDVGVRGGKAGVQNGLFPVNAAYPILSLPATARSTVEDAFILAISRQESEFNPRAISYANAHGLMQLLPTTARQQARSEGLSYRTSWLTDDPDYNIRLGSAHLRDLVNRFNGSYIMAAAAYNAGASRPQRWVREYGDPRLGQIDPVDWIEYIPFGQTRDYVQRILENIQVYRARLGQSDRITLSDDIARGAYR